MDDQITGLPEGIHAKHRHWRDQRGIDHHHVIVWGDLPAECPECGSTTAWNGTHALRPEESPVFPGDLQLDSRWRECGICGTFQEWDWRKLPGTATTNEIKAVADEIAADATEEHDKRVAEVKARLAEELADMKDRLANLDDDETEADVLGTDYEPGVYRHETGALVAWDYAPGAEAEEGAPADIITEHDRT